MTTSGEPARDAWMAALDPAANVRALGEIQRRGLDAARQLVDQLIAMVDGAAQASPRDETARGSTGGQVAGDVERLIEGWAALTKDTLRTMGALYTQAYAGPASSRGGRPVRLESGPETGAPVEQLWLHNTTSDPVSAVRLHCGDLRSPTAASIPASGIEFSPAAVDRLEAGTSVPVQVTVAVPAGTPPGVYRGTVLATGLADVWLPLEVVVTAAPAE